MPVSTSNQSIEGFGEYLTLMTFDRPTAWDFDNTQPITLTNHPVPDNIIYYSFDDGGLHPLNPPNGSRSLPISDDNQGRVRDIFTYLQNITGIKFEEVQSDGSGGDSAWRKGHGYQFYGSDEYFDVVSGQFIPPQKSALQGWEDRTRGTPSDGSLAYVQITNNFFDEDSGFLDEKWTNLFLHEILHGMGLGHTGPYNDPSTINFQADALYPNDSARMSIMSYFSENPIEASNGLDVLAPQTVMPADMVALDLLYERFGYGSQRAFTDDTVYGFNSNVNDPILLKMTSHLQTYGSYTIIDGGGIDTFDFSEFLDDNKIDLTVTQAGSTKATFSDIASGVANLALGVGVVIENAIGGSGNDEIIGNQYDNDLVGGFGDDTLRGDAGDDILIGGHGTDSISGGIGDDAIFGGEGNDILEGWAGADSIYDTFGDNQINAGHENDLVIVAQGTNIIIGSLGDDTLKGGNGNDTLVGGDGDDVLYGDTVLFSRAGDDLIRPGNGNDILQGGFGFDTFEFFATHTGANVIKRIDGGSDFDPTMDTIKLTGYGGTINANNIIEHISGGIGDAVITLDNQSITIVGISAFDFTNVPNLADLVFEFA